MNITRDTCLVQPTILVVDDDEATRMLAQHLLGDFGFDTREAPDGETALSVIADVQPDLILLDVKMLGISGIDVCRALRSEPRWRNLPIMMLTSGEDLDDVEAAFDAGATDFTAKPPNWPLLARRLRYLLRSAETLSELDRAQNSATIGSWTSVDGVDRMRWSAQLFEILGLDESEASPAWTRLELCVPAEDREKLTLERIRALAGGGCDFKHCIQREWDGQRRVVRHRIERVEHKSRPCTLYGTVQDITELYDVEQRVHRLAYYDSLTGLSNRLAFQDNINTVIARAKRSRRALALLYIDLDDFKHVNDTLGHDTGDMVLSETANRLRSAVRSYDCVGRIGVDGDDPALGRLGGDEFALIIDDLEDDTAVGTLSKRILSCFEDPFVLDNTELQMTASIGVACFPRHGTDEASLMKQADIAMHEAKQSGKNTVRFHDEELFRATSRRHEIELGLGNALQRGEMFLLYQPQLDLHRNAITGAEALLRWDSPELGAVSPVEFIPIAESSDLIVSIGEWVLLSACQQLMAWREAGYELERIAVNVSAKQFARSDFPAQVRRILTETGCPAHSLELEITETLLAADAEGAVEVLADLKSLGVHLSIDDFGTGYSSLSYLKRFPIDRLKIDRSFIREILSDPNDDAITSAVIGIARGMGLRVIAEGVETPEQLEMLKRRGCDEIQGYYLSVPLRAQELVDSFGQGAERLIAAEKNTG